MAVDTTWVKNRIGDEMGLTEEDLARLYGVEKKALDAHLRSLGHDSAAVFEKILSDVDAVRIGYRVLQISDDHIAAARALLGDFIFRPLVSVPMADGQIGWRLSSDDAQYVAFRTADIVGMDFEWSDVLRLRLKRLVVWPDETRPDTADQAFRDRVADITFYLAELTGVL
jgi:hypothetical protein